MARKLTLIYLFLLVLAVVVLVYVNRPYLATVSVINLDKSTGRWTDMQPQLAKLKATARRWPATDGRAMSEDDYKAAGIPHLILPSFAKEDLQKKRKGEIGCYLSHKRLIENLGQKWCLPNAGHMILEDDVDIDDNFREVLGRAFWDLPADWDILYLGIIDKDIQMDAPQGLIARVYKGWGTFGYIVRHGSIPKILDRIGIMFDPIDDMFYQSGLNLYAVYPFVVQQREGMKSDIHG